MKDQWTKDQVNSFNAFQKSGCMHPFTCGACSGELIATRDGCKCECGKYTQYWAHAWMLNWDWKKMNPFLTEELPDIKFYDDKKNI